MPIDLGVLQLVIEDEGGDDVLSKLQKIDVAAAKTGDVASAAMGKLSTANKAAAAGAATTAVAFQAEGAAAATAAVEVTGLAAVLSEALPIAIIAGVGFLISKFVEARERAAEAEEALDAYLDKLRDIRPEAQAIGFAIGTVFRVATAEANLARAKLILQEQLALGTPTGFEKATKAVEDAERELTAARRDKALAFEAEKRAGQEWFTQEAENLGKLLRANAATAEEHTRAAKRLHDYRAELLTLTATDDETTRRRIELLERIEALTVKVHQARAEHVLTEDQIIATLGKEVAAVQGIDKLRRTTFETAGVAVGLEQRISAELDKQALSLAQQVALLRLAEDLRRTASLELAKGLTMPNLMDRVPGAPLTFEKFTIRAEDQARLLVGDDPGLLAQAVGRRLFRAMEMGGPSVMAAAQRALDKIANGHPITAKLAIQLDIDLEAAAAVDQAFASFSADIAGTLASALGAAFSGESVGQVVLQGLGSIFMQMGASLIKYGLVMQGLLPALSNPFTSGPAALTAGALLVALGGTLGGIARGKTGGAGGGMTPQAASTREAIRVLITDPNSRRLEGLRAAAPMAAGPAIEVIGVDSARGKRLIGTANAEFVASGRRK